MHHIEPYNTSQTKRLAQIRTRFLQSLDTISSDLKCNYYDFLMVAKKLSFRFQQASHLMSLKNYFSKNMNSVEKKKLAELLILNVSAQSETSSDKTIIKFALSDQNSTFEPIQEMTNEDEDSKMQGNVDYEERRRRGGGGGEVGGGRGKVLSEQTSSEKEFQQQGEKYSNVEFEEKIEVIVSMKMHQMVKKVEIIGKGLKEAGGSVMEGVKEITFPVFKKIIARIFSNLHQEKIKISEDDIKTIFFLLDKEKRNELTLHELNILRTPSQFLVDLKEFYKIRINPELIKNTELKKGRSGTNAIQVFQLKNPSVLELKQIESALTEDIQTRRTLPVPSTKPRFGPLRHSYAKRKSSPLPDYKSLKRNPSLEILEQKDKIERILKASKEKKKERDSNETIASRLRRLFIHKVILPRERMLEEEKGHEKGSGKEYNLQVKIDKI